MVNGKETKERQARLIYTKDRINSAFNAYINRDKRDVSDLRWIRRRVKAIDGDELLVDVTGLNTTDFLSNSYTNQFTHLMRVKLNLEVINPTEFNLDNSPLSINLDRKIVLKHYGEDDGNGREDQSERYLIEAKVLKILSEATRRVPLLIHYYDNTIYMSDIDGSPFNEVFDPISQNSRKVLRHIMNNFVMGSKHTLDSELKKRFRENVDEAIGELTSRKLISLTDRISSDQKDQTYIPDIWAHERFERYREDDLREKRKFLKYKHSMIRSAIRNLFWIQRVGNQKESEILDILTQPNLRTPNLRTYVDTDIELLNYIISAETGGEQSYGSVFRNSQRQALEDILRDINRPLAIRPDDADRPLVQFTQGDSYSGNHVVKGTYTYLVDFDKTNFSYFGNDVADLLSYLSIFSDVRDIEEYYHYALEQKIDQNYMSEEQKRNKESYKDMIEKSFETLMPLSKIKRGLYSVGTLSRVIMKPKSRRTSQMMLRTYKTVREGYMNYWWNLLDETEQGQRLKEILAPKGIFVVK